VLLTSLWYAHELMPVKIESGLGGGEEAAASALRTYERPGVPPPSAFSPAQQFSGARPNASRMSRARQWRERCREANAARVTLPEATPPVPAHEDLEPSPGAAEAGNGLEDAR